MPKYSHSISLVVAIAVSGLASAQPGSTGPGTGFPALPPCSSPTPPSHLGGWVLVDTVPNWAGPIDVIATTGTEELQERWVWEFMLDAGEISCHRPVPILPINRTLTLEVSYGVNITGQASIELKEGMLVKLLAAAKIQGGIGGGFSWSQTRTISDHVEFDLYPCERFWIELYTTSITATATQELATERYTWRTVWGSTPFEDHTYCNLRTISGNAYNVTGERWASDLETVGLCWRPCGW